MRRSKKQPEYDPNELADLIGTPAVGTGVGSHLLAPQDTSDEVTTVDVSNRSPVVGSLPPTVDTPQPASVVPGRKSFPAPLPESPDTDVTNEVSPVGNSEPTTVVETFSPTGDNCPEDHSQVATVATSPPTIVGRLWISDSGEILPESRVHRIANASDALSAGEETLYRLLWSSPSLRETPHSRSVQAGYDSLTKGTRFSRKTIQRTVDRLIAKHYIEIETPADIYRRTSTVYRVYAGPAVLDRLRQHGRTHVAKIGPGVAFVAPLGMIGERPDTVVDFEMSTMD